MGSRKMRIAAGLVALVAALVTAALLYGEDEPPIPVAATPERPPPPVAEAPRAEPATPPPVDEVEPSDPEEPVETFTLNGRVLDEDGRPVEGVAVDAWRVFDDEDHRPGGFTDRAGRFSIEGVYDGKWALETRHARYEPLSQQVELLGPPTEVQLRLLHAASIELRVVDEHGATVAGAGAQTRLLAENAVLMDWGTYGYGATVADGTAEIGPLQAGTHKLSVDSADYLLFEREVEVRAHRAEKVEVTLTRGLSITGVVLGAGARPLPKAKVSLEAIGDLAAGATKGHAPQEVRTDDAGRFALHGLDRRRVRLRAEAARHAMTDPVEAEPGSDVTLQLVRYGGLIGRVLYRGQPVPAFKVNAYSFKSPDGRFELVGQRAGRTSLVVESSHAALLKVVEIPSDDTLDVGDFEVSDGGSVEGIVLRRREPMFASYVQLELAGPLGERLNLGHGLLNRDGSFSFGPLAAGAYDVWVSDGESRKARVVVEEGRVARVKLEWESMTAGTPVVHGSVRDVFADPP